MDHSLRDRLKSKLHRMLKCDWLEYNNATIVTEYIEANVTSLCNIWRKIDLNLSSIRADAAKDESAALNAYYEAAYCLEKIKGASKKEGRLDNLKKVLQFVDEAIILCPHSPSKQLAKLYAFRSMALFEGTQYELAYVAIKHALILAPNSIVYHTFAARYLMHLDKHSEALLHVKCATFVYNYPRAQEETIHNPPEDFETISLEQLRKMRSQIEANLARAAGRITSEPPSSGSEGLSDGSSCDSDSYDSEKDDTDGEQMEKWMQNKEEDEFDTPFEEGPKNFTTDYRCHMAGSSGVGKGRYYAASEEIAAETPILRERAYSIIILPELRTRRCHYCARDVTNRFWSCSKCNDTVYCGPHCAKLNWTLSHRFDCGLTKYWNGRSKSTFHVFRLFNRLGIRGVLKAIAEEKESAEMIEEQSNNEEVEAKYKSYDLVDYSQDREQRFTREVEKESDLMRLAYRAQMTLLDHSEKYSNDYLYLNIVNAIECVMTSCMAQGIGFEELSRDDLLELIGHCFTSIRRVLTNAFRWSGRNDQGQRIHLATCYLLVSSMFNHSCDPNAEWSIRSGYLTITTLRTINAGEELTISYGPSTTDSFESRQKRMLDGYFFQCNCSLCVEECRNVLALQCTVCQGPVLANPDVNSFDSRCLVCFEPYSNARDKLALLKRARSEVAIKARLLSCAGVDKPRYLASLKESLEHVISLIYGSSNLLMESIFVSCKVFRQEGHLSECLHYGSLVDELLPVSGTSLLVIADQETATGNSEDVVNESVVYTSASALHANIEHFIFWCSVYRAWVERTECKDEKLWSEMLRFYSRLGHLLKSTIAFKESQVSEQAAKVKETFETAGLREEINVLDSLKWYKQQELDRLKGKFANQLPFELARPLAL